MLAVVLVVELVLLEPVGAVVLVVDEVVVEVVDIGVSSQLRTGGAENDGGVTKAGFAKSKNSSIGSAEASRAVSDGRPNRSSMNRMIDV